MTTLRRALALLLTASLLCFCLTGCTPLEDAKSAVATAATSTLDAALDTIFPSDEEETKETITTKKEEMPTIALMPLDSRPCNTQYPALLAEATGATLLTPPAVHLDALHERANTDELWKWLEDEAMEADHLVLFTNTLFCGGLVASRSSGSYNNVGTDLAQLEELCNTFKAKGKNRTITVVQVLPRLTPNQFDDELQPYVTPLTEFGQSWDEADKSGTAVPTEAEGVPAETLAEYTAIHQKASDCAMALNTLTQSGLIDEFVISQDDGDELCPANITFRNLKDVQAKNTTLTHGADELGMMLLANIIAGDREATPVSVVYSSKSSASDVYPYESITLAEDVQEKLALSGLRETAGDSNYTLYIHAKTEDLQTTTNFISAYSSYLGIADVALTNQQDPALEEWLFDSEYFDNVDAYAAWNTAGNSIGTVCAMMRVSAIIDDRFDKMSKSEKLTACKNLFSFRAIRYSEDCFYMSNIRTDLQKQLEEDGLMKYTTVFTDSDSWRKADEALGTAYGPYNTKLAGIFDGPHTLCFGKNDVHIIINDYDSTAQFPWPRAFEVLILPTMEITLPDA